jgi:hypothetical protein
MSVTGFYLTDFRGQKTVFLSITGQWVGSERDARTFETRDEAEVWLDAFKRRRALDRRNPGNLQIREALS